MESSTFVVRPVADEAEWQQVKAIRQVVFVEEQRCPPVEEWDDYDETSRHLIGFVKGHPAATARWRVSSFDDRPVAKLERFAVLADFRGQGYGRMLVQYAMDDARKAGFHRFLLHAQAHLEAFYASFGFIRRSRDVFWEAGIPHVVMTLDEDARDAQP